MSKCVCCGSVDADIIWQPFGPGENAKVFTGAGAHYRGFPALHICFECQESIRSDEPVEFTYKRQRYVLDGDVPRAVPSYVEDVLLWLEEV